MRSAVIQKASVVLGELKTSTVSRNQVSGETEAAGHFKPWASGFVGFRMLREHRSGLRIGTVSVIVRQIGFGLLWMAFIQAEDYGVPVLFPEKAGLLDVRDYGANGDDENDDTEAIQRALDAHPNGNRIVYLPPGEFIVRDTLRWPRGESDGDDYRRTILQGSGIFYTTIRLPEATEGFDGPDPKPVIWTGPQPAVRHRNAVRDLRISIDGGNPAATGLQFNASSQGCVRNVAIESAESSGHTGLDLGHTDEIGSLLVRNLAIRGFEYGIVTKWPLNSVTFESVVLRDQRRLGWWNYHQMVFLRGLISYNWVPALYNEKDSWGAVSMIDSQLIGLRPERTNPGIINQRQMYFRNVEVAGYGKAVDNSDRARDQGDWLGSAHLLEQTSHANVVSQFRQLDDGTFATAGEVRHLPVKEKPIVPWGDPDSEWVSVVDFGADPSGETDSTAALQRAIDSGAACVFFPGGGRYLLGGDITIRGPVRRIIGLEGTCFNQGSPTWSLVDGEHPRGLEDAPTVVIERIENNRAMRGGDHQIKVRHASSRTLVMSSTMGFRVEGQGSGDLFLDDFAGHLDLLTPGQSAWCRQINARRNGIKIRNYGGNLWILGMRAERSGTVIETRRGGVTDATGILVYSSQGWEGGVPAFLIEDSTAILAGISERNFIRRPVSLWFRETQNGETRELRDCAWVYLSK
ncbi:MAG: glycosyl hydrolase family 28-related protein [Verrucomicrobiota bacterium]